MSTDRYPVETLHPDCDDGTMPLNVDNLADAVVGHKIVEVWEGPLRYTSRWGWEERSHGLRITLDNGHQVLVANTSDCCAYTEVEDFLLNVENIDHVITGVGTTDGYTTWHIFADFGDVMQMKVGWSCGNPFYYGYGFNITVLEEPQ